MALYAVIKGNEVDGVAIADAPLDSDGIWVCIDGLQVIPGAGWKYDGENFSPPPIIIPPTMNIPEPKTEEQKIADATAAAIAKLIADGVLKPA